MNDQHDEALVSIQQLETTFGARRRARGSEQRDGAVHAIDGVDLDIARGEVVALVGESGSGKTTLGRATLGLAPITAGRVLFDGQSIAAMNARQTRALRRRAQMIYQDAHASLSPRMRIGALLSEPYKIHKVPAQEQRSTSELLELVGLPGEVARKYPHEISGGQARRVGIARALSLHPEFLVADEPTAGLDVSVSASIFRLMRDLADQMSLTYLVITHNLNLAARLADRIAVMYLGRIVESGPTDAVIDHPAHPYTRALLGSLSDPDPDLRRGRDRIQLLGETPSTIPSGCRFHSRCRYVVQDCHDIEPAPTHFEHIRSVECHRWQEVLAQPPREAHVRDPGLDDSHRLADPTIAALPHPSAHQAAEGH